MWTYLIFFFFHVNNCSYIFGGSADTYWMCPVDPDIDMT